jgi:glycosyltransferase involved in cell wall biosynthesis
MHCNDVLHAPRYAQTVYGWQYLTISAACFRARGRIHAERVCIEKADILTAPCRRIIEEVQRQGLKCPSAEVVPNPYRPPVGWRNQPAAHPTVLFVGRLDGGKGIQYLPRLAESLRRWRGDAVLEIAGGDSYARFLGSMKGWLQRQGPALRLITCGFLESLILPN